MFSARMVLLTTIFLFLFLGIVFLWSHRAHWLHLPIWPAIFVSSRTSSNLSGQSYHPTATLSDLFPPSASSHSVTTALASGPKSVRFEEVPRENETVHLRSFPSFCKAAKTCPEFQACESRFSKPIAGCFTASQQPDPLFVFAVPDAYTNYAGHVFSYQPPILYFTGGCRLDNLVIISRSDLPASLHFADLGVLTHIFSHNIYTFLVEILPKYFQLLPLLKVVPNLKLVATTNQWDYLLAYFFPTEKWTDRTHVMHPIRFNLLKKGDWRAKVSPYVHGDRVYIPYALQCERPHFMPAFSSLPRQFYLKHLWPNHSNNRILANPMVTVSSRRKASRRKRTLIEEPVLINLLTKKYGGERVFVMDGFSASTFRDSINRLAQSKVLFGAHGANLGLMIFLPPSAWVIEVAPWSFYHPLYRWLANVSSLRYEHTLSKGKSDSPNGPIHADPNQVFAMIVRAMEQ